MLDFDIYRINSKIKGILTYKTVKIFTLHVYKA